MNFIVEDEVKNLGIKILGLKKKVLIIVQLVMSLIIGEIL